MNIFWKVLKVRKIVSKATCDQRENCPESHLPVTFTSCVFFHQWGVDTGENWPITGKERRVSTFAELAGKLDRSQSKLYTFENKDLFIHFLKTIITHTKSDKILETFKKIIHQIRLSLEVSLPWALVRFALSYLMNWSRRSTSAGSAYKFGNANFTHKNKRTRDLQITLYRKQSI
jgi:hypothetical protein